MLKEHSARHQGSAYAGAVANPLDGSTVFLNPAGMTHLDGPQGLIGGSGIVPNVQFSDQGSTVATPATGGAQVAAGGSDAGNGFFPVAIPQAYAAAPVPDNNDIWLGLSINSPFGLANDYGNKWAGRYDSTQSKIETVNIAPSVAYKVNGRWSVGAGLDVQYAGADLENNIPDPTSGSPTGATDGFSDLQGHDWSLGYNIGVLYEPTDQLRLGAHYRAEMQHEIDGRLMTVLPAGIGGTTVRSPGTVGLDLPASAGLGAAYDVGSRWTFMGQVNWYGWSSFDEIRVIFDDGSAPQVTPQNYDDSYAVSFGAEYRYNDNLTLRGGLQYDQTPTKDGFRTTVTPDADRYWFSLGGSYELNDRFSLDFAATHLFFDDADIRLRGASQKSFGAPINSSANVIGEVETYAEVFTLNLSYKF